MTAKSLASHIARKPNKPRARRSIPMPLAPLAPQTTNSAGKAVFKLDMWGQLDRFLILGSEGGSYYATERKLTADNAKNVVACIKADGTKTVNQIVAISESGRAPKNDAALLALALCASAGDNDTKRYAMQCLPKVARIGTHLFHFAEFAQSLRGWGRLMREGIANWYTEKEEADLAFQVVKYQSRDGWSHKDLIKLSHPSPDTELRNNVFKWVVKGPEAIKKGSLTPSIIIGKELASVAQAKDIPNLIKEYGIQREMIPTEHLNSLDVWTALLEDMPINALTRNLGKMTSIGLFSTNPSARTVAVERLTNETLLKKQRVHPFSMLLALNQYSQGRGLKGSLTWTPDTAIKNALNEAFYMSFGTIVPSGKRTLVGLDASASMTWGSSLLMGTTINARTAAACMAMTVARTEAQWEIMAFASGFMKVDGVTSKTTLEQMMDKIHRLPASATDCSLPMTWAKQNGVLADTFIIYTDNETNHNKIPPYQALEQYRQATGIPAKLIVVGMTANNFSIANSADPGMLDVVGFDAAAPNIISSFSMGAF